MTAQAVHIKKFVLDTEVADNQVLQSKLCCAGRNPSDSVALAADDVSLWIAVSTHLIVSGSGQQMSDDQSGFTEQLHRIEQRCTTHLKLCMLVHELHQSVDGKDAIRKTCHT